MVGSVGYFVIQFVTLGFVPDGRTLLFNLGTAIILVGNKQPAGNERAQRINVLLVLYRSKTFKLLKPVSRVPHAWSFVPAATTNELVVNE